MSEVHVPEWVLKNAEEEEIRSRAKGQTTTTMTLLPDPLVAASLTSEIGCYVEQISKLRTHELNVDVQVHVWL